jgi:hypothetical protein
MGCPGVLRLTLNQIIVSSLLTYQYMYIYSCFRCFKLDNLLVLYTCTENKKKTLLGFSVMKGPPKVFKINVSCNKTKLQINQLLTRICVCMYQYVTPRNSVKIDRFLCMSIYHYHVHAISQMFNVLNHDFFDVGARSAVETINTHVAVSTFYKSHQMSTKDNWQCSINKCLF